ncbi:macro domain-containing protein [Nocardia sp. 004]|uniref:macro domain-containing protein n=1 Tax=Nocardia sp. 004 TaxID=3385978 RepID=UPI0039A192F2
MTTAQAWISSGMTPEETEAGLRDLVTTIRENEIRSIAIPELGCGNSGLLWHEVVIPIRHELGLLGDTVDTVRYPPLVVSYRR